MEINGLVPGPVLSKKVLLQTLDVLSFSNFSILHILLLPQKRCLIISHSQKIFKICSKFDHKLVRSLSILVQAVLNLADLRIEIEDSTKSLEQNQSM